MKEKVTAGEHMQSKGVLRVLSPGDQVLIRDPRVLSSAKDGKRAFQRFVSRIDVGLADGEICP